MTEKLITFDAETRAHWVKWHNDPDGAAVEESSQNIRARTEIKKLRILIDLALKHPKDPDCAMLIAVIREAVRLVQ